MRQIERNASPEQRAPYMTKRGQPMETPEEFIRRGGQIRRIVPAADTYKAPTPAYPTKGSRT